MRISGYDSSSIGVLFSSFGKNAGSDLLGINYGDYACIKSGSYGKLMKAYYSKIDSKTSSVSKSSDIYKDTKTDRVTKKSSSDTEASKKLGSIKTAAENLTSAAKELYTENGNKVFEKNKDGAYDTDKIYSKVSQFVTDYNSTLTATQKSGINRINNTVSFMKDMTAKNENNLKAVGITVNEKTGALSIDKDTFKKADMSKVKGLFQGTLSYAYGVSTQASLVDTYAKSEMSKANTYNSRGSYAANYNRGNVFSDYI